MKTIYASAAFALLLSGSGSALACSCGGYASPCEAYAEADAVFTGRVKRVDPDNSPKGEEASEGAQAAYVEVESAFKGVVGPEVVLHQPGHSCAPKFKAGQRWLLYANYHKKSKTWEVFGCGRSAIVASAGDDLLYLQRLPAAATRLSGQIEHYEDDPEKGFNRVAGVAGVKVKITGAGQTHEVSTDGSGVYELYGLPPGKYTVEPQLPPGLKIRFPMPFGAVDYQAGAVAVELPANGCAGSNFIVSSDTSVGGRVFGADGKVMPRVCVNLVPADRVANPYYNEFDCTEEDGRFVIDKVPPGKYLLVANEDGRMSADEPFPPVYYPGVTEKEKATPVTVSEGGRAEGYDIHVPSQLPTSVVRGVLSYSDGRPVARESVAFRSAAGDPRYEPDAYGRTDEQGRFAIRVLRGTAGRLQGSMHLDGSKYKGCPHAAKLVRQSGGRMAEAVTNRVELEVRDDVHDVRLTFPFPFCQPSPEGN